MDSNLSVRLWHDDHAVTLDELAILSRQLRSTLGAVAEHVATIPHPPVTFEITEAGVGSLSFTFRACTGAESGISPDQVLTAFAGDLKEIREQRFRPTLTPRLTNQYLALVRALASTDTVVEYTCAEQRIVVDATFRGAFEFALRERQAEQTTVIGHLDAVSAHKEPYKFFIYPKLYGTDRIECRFAKDLVQKVAELIKQTVQVQGIGYFGPVGVYPVRMTISELPLRLECNRNFLRAQIRQLDLVPKGVSVRSFIQQNRRAAGIAE